MFVLDSGFVISAERTYLLKEVGQNKPVWPSYIHVRLIKQNVLLATKKDIKAIAS